MFALHVSDVDSKDGKCKVRLLVVEGDYDDRHKNSKSESSCLMLGLHCEMTNYELETFLEPYMPEISKIETLTLSTDGRIDDIELNSRCAIIEFSNEDTCNRFSVLYNNLHFPSYRNLPPCQKAY